MANLTGTWANDYERELSDILQLQHEIARAVATEISVKLNPQEEARFTSKQSLNPELYEAYLKGRFFWNKRTAGHQEGNRVLPGSAQKGSQLRASLGRPRRLLPLSESTSPCSSIR